MVSSGYQITYVMNTSVMEIGERVLDHLHELLCKKECPG